MRHNYHWRRWLGDSWWWRGCQLRWRRRRSEGSQSWRTRPGPISRSGMLENKYPEHFRIESVKRTHLGRPRIDWNSDVEPSDKPPNISWPPWKLRSSLQTRMPSIDKVANSQATLLIHRAKRLDKASTPLWELWRKDGPWLEEGGSKLENQWISKVQT